MDERNISQLPLVHAPGTRLATQACHLTGMKLAPLCCARGCPTNCTAPARAVVGYCMGMLTFWDHLQDTLLGVLGQKEIFNV